MGGEVVERQIDVATGEAKYVVCGRSESGARLCAVAKFGVSGKLVLITVFAE